tara:strand:+ start:25 stop:516 length:492 start_codon:yes stop_codon:yes gene_type:complete
MIWTNTSLFDSLLPSDKVTLDKNKATHIILGAPPIDIKEFPNVKFIFRAGVGTDNVNFSSDIDVKFPSEKTKNFINKENLKRFKSDAILINTARGPLVNEDDLYRHLKTTNMRAAFDAFWVEPYTGKLTEFKSDKFLMTPHIASSSIEFIESCYEDFIYYYER